MQIKTSVSIGFKMSFPIKCLLSSNFAVLSVSSSLSLAPKFINPECFILIKRFCTTDKHAFKIEYPSKNLELNTNCLPTGVKYVEEKENNNRQKICRNPKDKYSPEEVELILNYVDLYGCNSSTFKILEEELGRYYKNIQVKYYNLKKLSTIEQSDTRRLYRRFSKADDEIIMKYIEKHGEHDYVFLELASELNLRYVQQVKTRFSKLISGTSLPREKARIKKKSDMTSGTPKNQSEPRKIWTIEEDKQLLDIVFQVGN